MSAAATCTVWLATIDQLHAGHLALLDPSELARADRFLDPADRARSLLAAALLRLVAGAELGTDARAVQVRRRCHTCGGPHGKPSVGHGVELSVSHAAQAVVVATTRIAALGVDIESIHAGKRAEQVLRVGSRREHVDRVGSRREHVDRVGSVPEQQAHLTNSLGALRHWIRKESILKATGDGLAVPMADVLVSAPTARPRLLAWTGRATPDCTLTDLDPLEGYLGALAVLTTRPTEILLRPATELLAAA